MHGYKDGEGGSDVPGIVKFVLFSVVPIIQDMLLVLLFFRGMVLRQKRKDSRYDLLVSLSPVLLWAGAVCGGMLSVPVTLFGPDDMSIGVWVLFEVVVLACIAMLLAYCNETVTYDKSGFHARNLFGIERSYDYGEITGISRKGGDTVLHCGRHRIRLDSMSFGSDKFVAYADKAYFRQYKRYIPVFKPKKDPLNGNLDTPWLYLVVYVFILAGGILMSILSVSGLRPAKDELPADVTYVANSSAFSSTYRGYPGEKHAIADKASGDIFPFSGKGLDLTIEANSENGGNLRVGGAWYYTYRVQIDNPVKSDVIRNVAPGKVILPVQSLNRSFLKTLDCALSCGFQNIELYHISDNEERAQALKAQIEQLGIRADFRYEITPYRNMNEVLLRHIEQEAEHLGSHRSLIVMMGMLVVTNPAEKPLHNQTTQRLMRKLETYRNVSVFTVPYLI